MLCCHASFPCHGFEGFPIHQDVVKLLAVFCFVTRASAVTADLPLRASDRRARELHQKAHLDRRDRVRKEETISLASAANSLA